MIVGNTTQEQIEKAALQSGVRLVNFRKQGRRFAFTLGLNGELWRRRGSSGRRVASVCFHGHAAFMQHVFEAVPDALIKSMMATYNGVQDFQQEACKTGNRNVGSMMQPLAYTEACDCSGKLAEGVV